MKRFTTIFSFLIVSHAIFAQENASSYSQIKQILDTYFTKTNSTSIFLAKNKADVPPATRKYELRNDSLFIYFFDPKDAVKNEPSYDTSFVYLPAIAAVEIEKNSSSFSSKGIGLKFVPRVYRTINPKKTGSKSATDVELSEKEIGQLQGANITQKLTGQAAGVFVGGSSAPGSSTMVRIRGIGSINANSPLYIVDDVPISQNNINTINPEDIASVQVLKDASSTALYGVRGANGVVVIKTKKGNSLTMTEELVPLPNSTIELWIWGNDVDRFNRDGVKKRIKSLKF